MQFVQLANNYRRITGEGFTFLNIPRTLGELKRVGVICQHSECFILIKT